MRPWWTILAWLLLLAVAGVSAAGISDRLMTNWRFTSEPESVQGRNLLEEHLIGGDYPAHELVIIRSDSLTVDDPAFQERVMQVTGALAGFDPVASAVNYYQAAEVNPQQASSLVAEDRHSTLIPVMFDGSYESVEDEAEDYSDLVHEQSGNGFDVSTVGDLSGGLAFAEISESDLQRGELIAIPIAMVVLVLVFGALVAAGLPLILALVSIVVAIGIGGLLALQMDLSIFLVNMTTMMGLALGIDYALFIVRRYREERVRSDSRIEAIARTGDSASRAVLFSGGIVIVALFGLFLIPTTIFRSLALGAILAVVAAVLAMLTLVPALLSLIGDRLDWPRRQPGMGAAAQEEPVWGAIARRVMARPVLSLVLSTVILLALAAPVIDLEEGATGTGAESIPDGEIRENYALLESQYNPGILQPIDIVIDLERSAETEREIDDLIQRIEADNAFIPATALTWNAGDSLARLEVPLAMLPGEPESYDAVERLRDEHIPAVFGDRADQVFTTGQLSVQYDFIDSTIYWRPWIFAIVLGLSFVLLTLVFRSLIVPLKAIVMNLLSVGAAYGLLVLVFQWGVGNELFGFERTPTIEAWIPIFLFTVLFGLSMDYHIFLLSRIRENFNLSGDNHASVVSGLQVTGRLITGAALIMVVVFGGFAAGRLMMFQQMGFGLAVAILLDATLVRSVLVPSSMALLGSWNWYLPSWLNWLPNLWVEGRAGAEAVGTPPVEPAFGADD
ncbi:MAG: MMPL family transporter [Thermomicrobiales bacterium]